MQLSYLDIIYLKMRLEKTLCLLAAFYLDDQCSNVPSSYPR